jgi:1-acyl-sn-glycerol-3-phosphate acyltransferase
MDDWKYNPAQDLGLSEKERLRSIHREPGLLGHLTRNTWWLFLRTYFALFQKVTTTGKQNLPTKLPFILVANHASHFDALLLALALPLKLRNHVFPIAAGDTFFETPILSAFAAGAMNALPMWRKNAGRHAMEQLRSRLINEPCGYILFPEGTRSRTGQIAPFRAGVGMLIANANVPIIPCHLQGTFHALPANKKIPRRSHITLTFGPPLSFHQTPNTREGWNLIATTLEQSIRNLTSTK